MEAPEKDLNRREFLKTSSAAATAGVMLTTSKIAFGAEANDKLRLGLFGCGSRGPWIANFFEQHTNSKCVAVFDYFRDKVQAAGRRFGVGEDMQFVGLDGYKQLLETDIDAVAVISPAYFHPEQAVAALEAGKHVYLAKPIAVDVPGCQAVVEAARKHEENLTTLVDFQTRVSEPYIEVAKAIHEGWIGKPVSGQAFFHGSRLNIRTKPGTDVAKLRNWFFDIPLSGDVIVEQSIHMVDVANWFLQGHPEKAFGTGGRKARTDVGDAWDHFNVLYTYPNDVTIDFGATQFLQGYVDLRNRIFGTEGTVDAAYGGDVWAKNRKGGPNGKTPQIYPGGAIANIKRFHESVITGKPINNTAVSAESTMAAVLGRMAAYEDRTVTWEEMLAKNEKLDPQLDLPADGPETAVERV
jgi:predicted dehydrogenase